MGSLGADDGDGKIRPLESDNSEDLDDDADTQIFDSQFSPSLFYGGEFEDEDADRLRFLHSTQPFEDTARPEDIFETQVVNLDGETQAVNLDGETQVVNFSGETQVVNVSGETQAVNLSGETQVANLGDNILASDIVDSFENFDTQLFVDYDTEVFVDTDGEGSERTQVIDDSEDLSDDGYGRQVHAGRPGKDVKGYSGLCVKGSDRHQAESDAPSNEHCGSGCTRRGFTSIRTASVRASGMAARDMAAFKDSNSESRSTLCDSQSVKEHATEHKRMPLKGDSCEHSEAVDQDCTPEEYAEQIQGPRNDKICRVGRPTARKLFSEDTVTENIEVNDHVNIAGGGELPPLFHCGNEFAGLSYADSQEPGESSQANALNFVDKFLKVNVIHDDKKDDIGKFTWGKSDPVSCAKGAQSLAKSANLISTAGERGIFDWDDNREDEGGGEFYRKKKEVLSFNGDQTQKSFPQSRKTKRAYSNSERVTDPSGEKKHMGIHDKLMGLVCTKSRMELANHKGKDVSIFSGGAPVREATLRKNLIKELDEQVGSRDGIIGSVTDKDIQEVPDIRFDTQMAAEAMEALSFGLGGADHNAEWDSNILPKSSNEGQKKNMQVTQSKKSMKRSQPKKTATKLSKDTSGLSPNRSLKVRKQCEQEPVNKPKKRLKADAKEHITSKGSANLKNASCIGVKKRKKEEILREQITDVIDGCPLTPSAGRMSVNKQFMQESFSISTPVARRTRQSMKVNKSESVKDTTSDLREINGITGFYPKRRRTNLRLSSLGQEVNGQSVVRDGNTAAGVVTGQAFNCSTGMSDADVLQRSVNRESNSRLEGLPSEQCQPSTPSCTTPVCCVTPVKDASPICMGDEYLKQSCRRSSSRSSLLREIDSLVRKEPETITPNKDSRRRRDMADVRVLFSRHLDGDIIKQQKKILSRLGASVASSDSDATHFVADSFVRTKNMLEAIAFGKPVVTHLWLESCGQACCLIDEKKYILRDARKEKEFGFSLPVSLTRARQHPLLQGQRVLITPNTKPGIEILSSLVKAVNGLPFERIGRTAVRDNKIPDDLLILSCEDDYADCVPFLEKGASVYSSELLLNGIVTQRLEYERHRLFADHFRRTRSTKWLKKDTSQHRPVTKCK